MDTATATVNTESVSETNEQTSNLEAVTTVQSLGEEFGEFKNYDPQVAPAHIEGTRVVKCLYKTTANTKDKRTNQYVRIPDYITEDVVVENLEGLMDYVIGFLQDTEDKIIKDAHKKYQSRIYTEFLTVDKIIDFLEQQESSGRLTKEKIESWFNTNMVDKLTDAFLEKTNDEAKIAAIIAAYKVKFESLAGGRTYINPQDCEAMLKAMDTAEVLETSLGKRFKTRLEGMEASESNLLESL